MEHVWATASIDGANFAFHYLAEFKPIQSLFEIRFSVNIWKLALQYLWRRFF